MDKKIIIDIIYWININIETKLSIDLVAKKSGYSKWYLQRVFKQYANISLGQYLLHKRLELAAIELKGSYQSVTEIAYKFNFDSPQTFSRIFKKKFNLSPKQYRIDCSAQLNQDTLF